MVKNASLLIILSSVILSFSLQTELKAEMYVCVDANGKAQYTNMNISGSCRPLSKRVGITRRPGLGRHHSYSQPRTFRQRKQRKSSSYDHYISRSSRRYNVDPFLIKAVIKTESDFDCYALSKKGAQGLMQLMPATARELKVRNPFNPHENIDGGTKYLRNMLDIFDGNVPLSLAAYNAGPTLVKRLQRIPKIPETINYVRKVLGHYKGYRGYLPKAPVRLAANEKK